MKADEQESTIWRKIRRGADDIETPRKVDPIPPLTADHPIFRLVGTGRSGGVLPGARDKHAIIDQ